MPSSNITCLLIVSNLVCLAASLRLVPPTGFKYKLVYTKDGKTETVVEDDIDYIKDFINKNQDIIIVSTCLLIVSNLVCLAASLRLVPPTMIY